MGILCLEREFRIIHNLFFFWNDKRTLLSRTVSFFQRIEELYLSLEDLQIWANHSSDSEGSSLVSRRPIGAPGDFGGGGGGKGTPGVPSSKVGREMRAEGRNDSEVPGALGEWR